MLNVAMAPVDGRQRQVAVAVVLGLTATTCALLPLASTALPVAPGAVPFVLGIALAAQLVTAYLLMSQFMASRLLGTAFLGGAYLVGGLSLLAYVVTFPGVSVVPLGAQIAPWNWVAWHFEFPGAVCVALWFDRKPRFADDAASASRWVYGIVAGAILVAAIPALAIVQAGTAAPFGVGKLLLFTNILVLALGIRWTQGRTVLHMWLVVALVATCLDVEISLAGGAPFTVGWYAGRMLIVCSSAAVLFAYLRQMDTLFATLRDLSMIDGLTALPNRRFFETRLHAAIRTAHRGRRPLALLILDVDAFKQFNDTYGHQAGDAALKAVAATLRRTAMRPGDVIARWGGEEFIAFLSETEREGAYQVAERLRASIAALAIPHRTSPVLGGTVTISVGIATLDHRDDDAAALVDRADAAMYRAKSGGRNAVAVELGRVDGGRPTVAT